VPRIDALLDAVLSKGGTDLHVAPGAPPLARVRGELVAVGDGELAQRELEELLVEPLAERQRARLKTELALEFSFSHKETTRFRASYFVKLGGLAAVFHVLPARAPSLAELGAPDALRSVAERRSGLVLVCGPSRSGASTTAAALIDHVNKTRACHILTIEEPIEIVHEPVRSNVTHREVGVHAASFAAALKSAARESPDVVLVSDLRSADVAGAALTLATSGALVVATIHASGVVSAIDRVVASHPVAERARARAHLADALAAAVGLELVPTVDGKGRVAVYEILVRGEAASLAIRQGKTGELTAIMQGGEAHGMATTDAALERLVSAGRVHPETALEHAQDREAFARVLSRVRPDLDIA
jgi:twitching motility protein PilT